VLRPSRTVTVDGLTLTIPRGVLDPVLFRSGAWAAQAIADHIQPGTRLLDLGCGSGVVGALCQRAGAAVVAVDIDRRAVRAARANGLPDVRHGDLFAPVRGERFHTVCFNPPYFTGRPHLRRFGRALYGGRRLEVIRRFAAALPEHLTPTGEGLVVLSDRAPGALEALGAGWSVLAEAVVTDALGSERLILYRLRLPAG
jgi:methylase of polypeptide subunit release factors